MFAEVKRLGTSGIISDISPIELPSEVISDGNNIRITSSGVHSAFGHEIMSTNPTPFNPGFILHNHATDDSIPTWIMAGDESVYSYDLVWTDVSPITMVLVDNTKWTGCNLGKMAIINHPDLQPEYYDCVEKIGFTFLPFKPGSSWGDEDKSCKIIRSFNTFLFALNLTESGENYPDGYRWSHPADANGIPFTWDETDPSSIASRESLGGQDGAIIDALALRNAFVIYSERGIDVLDYTGDDYLFARRSLVTSAGLLATNCVLEHKGMHYYISDGDVLVNDGTSVTSIMQDKIRGKFISDISTDHYENSYAVRNDINKELWFCIPTGGSIYANVAYVYNWFTKTWGRRDILENTTFSTQGGVVLPKVTWNSVVGAWDDAVRTWNARRISPENEAIVGCNSDSSANIMDVTDANSETRTSFIERRSLPLEGAIANTTVDSIYPHMTGSAKVRMRVGAQEYAGGTITWDEYVNFEPKKDRKVDVRSTGALMCYRIEYTGRASWSITGMDVEYASRGRR